MEKIKSHQGAAEEKLYMINSLSTDADNVEGSKGQANLSIDGKTDVAHKIKIGGSLHRLRVS